MLQTSSVREAIRKKGQEQPGVVAVANSPREIMLRWNGRAFFGKEETLCYITTDDKIIFRPDVAKKYGFEVIFEEQAQKGAEE